MGANRLNSCPCGSIPHSTCGRHLAFFCQPRTCTYAVSMSNVFHSTNLVTGLRTSIVMLIAHMIRCYYSISVYISICRCFHRSSVVLYMFVCVYVLEYILTE